MQTPSGFSLHTPLPMSWILSFYLLSSPCILSILLFVCLLHCSSLWRLTLYYFSPYDRKVVTVSSWTFVPYLIQRTAGKLFTFSIQFQNFLKRILMAPLGQLPTLSQSGRAKRQSHGFTWLFQLLSGGLKVYRYRSSNYPTWGSEHVILKVANMTCSLEPYELL